MKTREPKCIGVKLFLDPIAFKEQRQSLGEAISLLDDREKFPVAIVEGLEGIQSLCDEIADQAHDLHGMDTLNMGTVNTEQIFHNVCEAMQDSEEMFTDLTFEQYVDLMRRISGECDRRIKAAFSMAGDREEGESDG